MSEELKLLYVEDSKALGTTIKKEIEKELKINVVLVPTYEEASNLLKNKEHDFFAALLDLNLPDAPDGQIIDLVTSQKISSIIFTGTFNEETREKIWSKPYIADYILKEGVYSIPYVVSLIRRLSLNRTVKVLVVDDSSTMRKYICNLLLIHKYQVFEASDGKEALEIIEKNQDIKLVITDYNMPEMDGFQLTKKIRQKFNIEELAIIGASSQDDKNMTAKFLKFGANDFLSKPFLSEEFYCRVTMNVNNLEYIQINKELSIRDFLTELYNRRYFYEIGQKMFASLKRQEKPLSIAMLDIDHFKKINDTYGHDCGDEVLTAISQVLKSRFRASDIVSRFGGEEFCIFATGMDPDCAVRIFEELRQKVKETVIIHDDKKINVTISIGVCNKRADTLEEMVKEADRKLYEAKDGGRDRVVC